MIKWVWIISHARDGHPRLNVVDSLEKAEAEIKRYRGLGWDPVYEKVLVR